VAELLDRARQLVAGGPHVTNISELIAVHALLYPARDPVCDHCPAEQGKAYYAIQRWVTQQENSLSTSTSNNVKKGTTARFHSDQLIYTPHGLGVAYNNDNLTDKAARDILKADPDAAQHFAVLPPAAEEGEDEPLTEAQASAAKQVEKAQHPVPAPTAPVGFDYNKLASAMIDELQRREAEAQAKRDAEDDGDEDDDQGNEQPSGLTDSTGGAGEGDATSEVKTETLDNGVEVKTGTTDTTENDSHDGEQPVRLSRMDKKQLVATYKAELNLEPAEGLTNDQLRDAIAEHRTASAQ
jgi:hypothetical protein